MHQSIHIPSPLRGLAILIAISCLALSSVAQAKTATTTIGAKEEDRRIASCIDNWETLQQAILDIQGSSSSSSSNNISPEILLCPSTTIEFPQAIQIRDVSVKIKCATTTNAAAAAAAAAGDDKACILKGAQGSETRMLEIVSSGGRQTVTLNNIHFISGENYKDDNHNDIRLQGGGAVFAQGVNLIIEDCYFEGGVSSQKGGAISVQDDAKRPILFIVTRTRFQDNLSIEDDCHSIYFHQQHSASIAQVNSEYDYIRNGRKLEHWDDPAKAAQALQDFLPAAGATLCF